MAKDENGLIRIALTGKMRSGKSTLARHLWLMYDLEVLSFGTALKRVADELFADSDAYKFEPKYEFDIFAGEDDEDGLPLGANVQVGHKKPRKLYQDVGQTLRTLDEDVWVRQLARQMRSVIDSRSVGGVVIDDLRQPNEYDWARENGFTIIRINSDEETRVGRAKNAGDDFTAEDMRHDTEQHIDGFEADYDVWNGDDIAKTKAEIDEIVAGLRGA